MTDEELKAINEKITEEYTQIVEDQQKKQEVKLTKNDFETISVIGKGSYGKVTLVKKKDNGKLYALK